MKKKGKNTGWGRGTEKGGKKYLFQGLVNVVLKIQQSKFKEEKSHEKCVGIFKVFWLTSFFESIPNTIFVLTFSRSFQTFLLLRY